MRPGKLTALSLLTVIALTASAGRAEPPAASAASSAVTRIAQAAPPAARPAASKWKQGRNYELATPPQPTSVAPGKIEVIEFFWYACPHCYKLEPHIVTWDEKKASYIQFTRVPATFSVATLLHARLYYTLLALKRADLHAAAFKEANLSENALLGTDIPTTQTVHIDFGKRHGIDPEKFREAYNSKAVLDQVKHADALSRSYQVPSVPYIIINGKYKSDLDMVSKSEPQLMALINDLAAQEHQAKR